MVFQRGFTFLDLQLSVAGLHYAWLLGTSLRGCFPRPSPEGFGEPMCHHPGPPGKGTLWCPSALAGPFSRLFVWITTCSHLAILVRSLITLIRKLGVAQKGSLLAVCLRLLTLGSAPLFECFSQPWRCACARATVF